MSQADEKGFEYCLEPVRRRSQLRVDAAINALGQQRRALERALGELDRLRKRCDELAHQSLPRCGSIIDPWRSMAAARAGKLWRDRVFQAQLEVKTLRERLALAQGAVERAHLEHAGLEAHHADALSAYRKVVAQRLQNAFDHDWLARHHHPSAARFSIDQGM